MVQIFIQLYLYSACPFNSQYFISENHTLLPLENVAATSEHQDGPASFFITPRTNPWCTSAEDATLPGQHINLTFTEPVVLTLIQSGGFFNGYVNNFSLAYTDGDSEEFTTYSISNYSEVSEISTIPSPHLQDWLIVILLRMVCVVTQRIPPLTELCYRQYHFTRCFLCAGKPPRYFQATTTNQWRHP